MKPSTKAGVLFSGCAVGFALVPDASRAAMFLLAAGVFGVVTVFALMGGE